VSRIVIERNIGNRYSFSLLRSILQAVSDTCCSYRDLYVVKVLHSCTPISLEESQLQRARISKMVCESWLSRESTPRSTPATVIPIYSSLYMMESVNRERKKIGISLCEATPKLSEPKDNLYFLLLQLSTTTLLPTQFSETFIERAVSRRKDHVVVNSVVVASNVFSPTPRCCCSNQQRSRDS
jgi:hypothetical protein